MLDALLKSMPKQLVEEARGIHNLFILTGCTAASATRKVAELYSPPRVTKEIGRFPNLSAGSTFDLIADEQGRKYDFLRASDRQRCRERLRAERPWLVVGSPPCTWWSTLMALNMARMTQEDIERRGVEAKILLDFACEVYQFQLEVGRHFLHEHPAGARSWAQAPVEKLMAHPGVGSVVGHQCQYGQWTWTADGKKAPVLKATWWLSSAPEILARLGHKCRGGHRHQALVGGRAVAAAIYPLNCVGRY